MEIISNSVNETNAASLADVTCAEKSANKLTLQNVSAGYGEKIIVRDVSVEIEGGCLCALLGLNGSGKTTLIKAVCGLLPISGGRCFVGDIDCTRLHEHKRARYISYIPQRHSKLVGVTVKDAAAMGLNPKLGLFEFPSKEDMEYVLQTLEKMNISHLANSIFSELSEGQKQLVILARTLVQNCPIMLLDEPDSALDFNNRHKMLTKIRNLVKIEYKVALMALHDPNLALKYCDRLLIFKDGTVAADITVPGSAAEKIRDALSVIYGDINVFELGGELMVTL